MRRKTTRHGDGGYTLVETLIVVMILVILGEAVIGAILTDQDEAKSVVFASNLRLACDSFRLYRVMNGKYPPDRNPAQVPPGMAGYLEGLNWTDPTPIGGKWDWDQGVFGYTAGVSVYKPDRTAAEMAEIDEMIDDGDLTTGAFRQRSDGYICIIQQ